MSRRRKHKKEKENGERWLITYSDLITLLMIFFVVMYAMSKIDETKFIALEKSLAAALNNSHEIPLDKMGKTSLIMAANPDDAGNKALHQMQNLNTQQKDKQLDQLFRQVNQYIKQHHLQGNVQIANQARGVQITLRDVVLFDTGNAVIKPEARGLLSGLVPFFQQLSNPIVIEGYTDNQPIDTPAFPTNWELSSARATGVVRFLVDQGIQPERLSEVGYGQYHELVKNDTPAHRQMNRRVNIVILRDAPAVTSSLQ